MVKALNTLESKKYPHANHVLILVRRILLVAPTKEKIKNISLDGLDMYTNDLKQSTIKQ